MLLEWIIDAYLLVFSVLLLPAGALGDRYGRRKALISGLIIFGGASAAAMTVTSATDLIFLRGLIGLGAALVMPATLSTITGTFPPAERTKAVGVWAAVAGGSAILGLLVSGLLLQLFSWQAAFAINVLLAAMALAGTVRFVPESSQPDAPALDKVGALLATVGLVALVFSIIEAPDAGWLSARTVGGTAAGLVALALVAQARSSFAVAIHAGGSIGAHARDAFVDGIHTGLLYAAGAAILAAISVAILLESETSTRRPAGRGERPQAPYLAEQIDRPTAVPSDEAASSRRVPSVMSTSRRMTP